VRVGPSQANDLPRIIGGAAAGTTVLLDDGLYRMTTTGEAQRRITMSTSGVTLRSASSNAAAVILDGEYLTDEILSVQASNVTIAHLTVMRAVHHPIHVSAPEAGPDVTGCSSTACGSSTAGNSSSR
jgi:hypothetical protein